MKRTMFRDGVQQGIYKVINPFVRLLIRFGLTPNMVTIIGLILNICVAVIFIVGGEEGNRGDFSYVGWAGGLILFAGLFDMLDGQVARLGNMSSTFGAFLDSVLDRYSELIMFLGICYYLVAHHYFVSSLITFIAVIGSVMVSYTRARAEGLGIQNKGGLMQRPERVITVALAAIACSVTAHYVGGNYKLFVKGIPFHLFEPMLVFTVPLTFLAVMTNVTAIQRIQDAKREMEAPAKKNDDEDDVFKQKKETSRMRVLSVLFALVTILGSFSAPVHPKPAPRIHTIDPSDTFPVPTGIKNQLFYLQRTPNTNTIVCQLNQSANGALDPENPVHVFWIRYTENARIAELSYLQRTFAYGIRTRQIGTDKYELHFVSYKKYPMYLMKSGQDSRYHVYGSILQKQAIVNRIFIKINPGGTFWSPNIEYIEVKGIDPVSGKEIRERRKV